MARQIITRASAAIASKRPALAAQHFEAALHTIEQTRLEFRKPDNEFSYLASLIRFYQAYVDALVDQGMLVRTTAEKKVLIIASKQVNNYDLSDKGRAADASMARDNCADRDHVIHLRAFLDNRPDLLDDLLGPYQRGAAR